MFYVIGFTLTLAFFCISFLVNGLTITWPLFTYIALNFFAIYGALWASSQIKKNRKSKERQNIV